MIFMTSFEKTFFNKHIFIHTHIEKCGGSSLLRHMTTLLGYQHVYDLRPFPALSMGQLLEKHPEIKKNRVDTRLLSGHIWYDSPWSKLFSKKTFPCDKKHPLYIASVRHPIERLNSFFRYVKANPTHPYWQINNRIKNDSFDEFIQELIFNDNIKTKNEISMQITRCRDSVNLFQKAKNSFEHNYFAIVPYNKTHELANMIAEVLKLPHVEDCIVNSNNLEKKIIPSKEIIALLEEKCSEDIKLYDYVCKNYQEKLVMAKDQLLRLVNKG